MISKYLTEYGRQFDGIIENYLEAEPTVPVVYESMKYSLEAGGKRIRPALFEITSTLLGYKGESLKSFQMAIEMIHTYSLIHDDLPAMDNDTLRRGKPTNHMVYGESFAILAGDGLLNKAYEILFQEIMKSGDPKIAAAAEYIARSSGTKGMVGGQAMDLYYEKREGSFQIIEEMHRRKTGALLKAPILAACLAAGADEDTRNALEAYGDAIGLAFQISDDILDFTGEVKVMGKTTGKDLLNEKKTYVTEFGLAKARAMAAEQCDKAIESLARFGDEGDLLRELARFIVARDK